MIDKLIEQFSDLDDPRCLGKVERRLLDILVIAINLLALDRSTKASLRGKRKKAAWNDNYMLQLLQTHFTREPWVDNDFPV